MMATSLYLFADNTLSDSIYLFHSKKELEERAKEDYVFMETKEPDSVLLMPGVLWLADFPSSI